MNYFQAKEWISNLTVSKGMVFGLKNMEALVKGIGGFRVPTVHVAGTNGKGSVCEFVTNILIASGYNVGTYTSPAVGHPLEIIRVNEKCITEEEYALGVTKIKAFMEAEGIEATAFEIETGVAFDYFNRNNCDLCVVECGLGGKLDATNIITSTKIAVFASIGMDHMHILGDSLEEIAENKAGIIKENVIVVNQNSNPHIENVLRKVAADQNSRVITIHNSTIYKCQKVKTVFNYANINKIVIHQPGQYQVKNAATAIETAKALQAQGFDKISIDSIRAGLASTKLAFRYEKIMSNPILILDGAHNENAISQLMQNIKYEFNKVKVYFIIGMFKDKDYETAISLSQPFAKEYVAITPPGPRGFDSEELCNTIRKVAGNDIPLYNAGNVKEALRYILQKASKDDIIVAFGSLSYLASLKETVEKGVEKNDR